METNKPEQFEQPEQPEQPEQSEQSEQTESEADEWKTELLKTTQAMFQLMSETVEPQLRETLSKLDSILETSKSKNPLSESEAAPRDQKTETLPEIPIPLQEPPNPPSTESEPQQPDQAAPQKPRRRWL